MLAYFDNNGLGGVLSGPYNAFWGGYLGDVNVPYQTTMGPVDADWMLRTYMYGVGGDKVTSNAIFYGGKSFWNVVNGTSPFDQMHDPSYTNAPNAMAWLVSNQGAGQNLGPALRQLFAPALANCGCGGK